MNPSEDQQDEEFFTHIDDSLCEFFDAELDEAELESAYPIQNEIKNWVIFTKFSAHWIRVEWKRFSVRET